MTTAESVPSRQFKVWASDNLVYGPVDLPTLEQWVEDQRIIAETWVHSETENAWRQARDIPDLARFFHSGQTTVFTRKQVETLTHCSVEEVRQFNIFSALSNDQLEQFVRFCSYLTCNPGDVLIQKGEPGDAIYFLLTGDLRARLVIGLQDTTVGSIVAGEFFGEMAMFTHGSRSADVVAVSEARLLRLSAESFLLLLRELPSLAGPILYAIAQVMARRIADSNKSLQREVAGSFIWR